jgi:hypothetical protein
LKRSQGEKSSSVPLEPLQDAVLDQIMADAQSPEFVHELAAEVRRVAQLDDPAKLLRRQLDQLEKKVAKAGELALQLEDPEPMLKIIEQTRRKQEELRKEIHSLDKESAVRNALASITDEQVATVLKDAVEPTALLKTVVSRITLNPDTQECQIHYQLPMWLNVASPRGLIRIGSGRFSGLRPVLAGRERPKRKSVPIAILSNPRLPPLALRRIKEKARARRASYR